MSDKSNSPPVEIIVKLKLPIDHYEVATILSDIYNYKHFDDFVSDLIKDDIERDTNMNTNTHHRSRVSISFY